MKRAFIAECRSRIAEMVDSRELSDDLPVMANRQWTAPGETLSDSATGPSR
jgi:hypothetical protein